MRFLLQLHGDLPADAYGPLAARAEALGFEDVTLHDVLLRRPCWPVLADVARATSRVLVGPNVTHPWMTHPVQIAANLRHLDEVSEGRAICGIGRGSMYDLVGRDDPSTLAGLAEAIGLLGHLLRDADGGVDGEVFTVRPHARLTFGTPREIPVYVGSLGPKGAHLAGRVAAGLRAAAQWDPGYVAFLAEHVAAGAVAAGRDPDDVDVIAENWTYVHPDRERARHEARLLLATFLPYMTPLIRHHDIPDDEVHAAELASREDRPGEAQRISDRTLDAFMAAGDVDDVVAGLRRLDAAGVDAVSFSGALGPDTELALELLGRATDAFVPTPATAAAVGAPRSQEKEPA